MKVMLKAISVVGLVLLAALVCSSTQPAGSIPEGEAFISSFLRQLTRKYLGRAGSDVWTVAAYYVDEIDYARAQIFTYAANINDAENKALQIGVSQTGKLEKIIEKFETYAEELKSDVQAIRTLLYKKLESG